MSQKNVTVEFTPAEIEHVAFIVDDAAKSQQSRRGGNKALNRAAAKIRSAREEESKEAPEESVGSDS